jgi:hypothetical protein
MGLGKLGRSGAAPVREYVEERFLAQKGSGFAEFRDVGDV